jgi:beta-lactam-binding protein with PASTA domain
MQERKAKKSGFFSIVFSKQFMIHPIIAFILLMVLFFSLNSFLDIFTRFGKEIVVPDFYGKAIDEIIEKGYSDDFDFFVIDSMYDDNSERGTVVIQNPIPGSRVKKGRNIYFTIVASSPENVIMPDLRDLTVRQAINILESAKLKAGQLIYKPSFDENAVLEQLYRDDTIAPGDTLVKGSVIDLLIGSGERIYQIPVPFLIGKTREEAIYAINTASYNLGAEFYMDSIMDEHARVYMQEPLWNTDIPGFPGDSIHLWYKSDELFDFETYAKSIETDSLQVDSLNAVEPEEAEEFSF